MLLQQFVARLGGELTGGVETVRGLEESEQMPSANQRIDLAYELEVNRWNGEIKLQLNVRDMKI